jgi:hypothetical protein
LNVLMNIQTPLSTSLAEIRPLNMVSSIYWLVSSKYWRLQLMGLATQSTVCERECRSSSVWLSWLCMRCANIDCFWTNNSVMHVPNASASAQEEIFS